MTDKVIFKRLSQYVDPSLHEHLHEAVVSQNDYVGAFSYMDRKNRISAYTSIFNVIPDALKYNLFIEVYSMPDKGFVKSRIIDRIYELRPKELIATELAGECDIEGYITVYRGTNPNSTRIDRAISWTLDPKVAEWFIGYGNMEYPGHIYTAKAHIDHVVSCIIDREENEVLVRYQDVQIISKVRVPK